MAITINIYYFPFDDNETVLLIDSWTNQKALDFHHQSPMMKQITELREKYDLYMEVERYISDDANKEKDSKFIRQ